MTTPLQFTFLLSWGDWRVRVISVQGAKGLVLRNSMPFLWRMTELGESVSRVCLASTVTCWGNELPASIFLALIQHCQNNTHRTFVNEPSDFFCIGILPSHR